MTSQIKSIAGSLSILTIELLLFYGVAYGTTYFVDPSKAEFLAGFSSFLVLCACGIGRTPVPHLLLRLFVSPSILIIYASVVVFSVLGKPEPDLTVFVPGFALALFAATLGERIGRLLGRKRGKGV